MVLMLISPQSLQCVASTRRKPPNRPVSNLNSGVMLRGHPITNKHILHLWIRLHAHDCSSPIFTLVTVFSVTTFDSRLVSANASAQLCAAPITLMNMTDSIENVWLVTDCKYDWRRRRSINFYARDTPLLVGCVAQWLERWSLTGEFFLSFVRHAADGWPLMSARRPLQFSQLGKLSLSSFRGR